MRQSKRNIGTDDYTVSVNMGRFDRIPADSVVRAMSNNSLSLEKLFNPRSIAVVGASNRPNAYGSMVLDMLAEHDCPLPIYPVNPRQTEIKGMRCYPALASVPEPVDLAYIALPAALGADVLEQAAEAGVAAVAIPGSGYADGGPEGEARQARIVEIANRHRIPICGPNNLGFVSHLDRVIAWPTHIADIDENARVALITQSGSAGIAISQDPRGLGFAYMVSTGNEANVNAADYLDYFAGNDRVEVILVYLETLREPGKFARAAEKANAAGKRIAAVKVGRSESAQRMVAAHTGGIAGEDAVYDAFFRRHGILRAEDLDGLVETGLLLAAMSEAPPRGGVALITVSGGEAALAADLLAEKGVLLPDFAPRTVRALESAFPPFATPRNPVDAYGLGWDRERFARILHAVLADDAIGTAVLCMDTHEPGVETTMSEELTEVCVELAGATEQAVVFVNNTSGGGINPDVQRALRAAQVPALLGMREGLSAVAEWLQAGAHRKSAREDIPSLPSSQWRAKIETAQEEVERFALLAEAGVPMAETRSVASADEAVAVASELGGPIALKGSAPGLLHKTERALVEIGLQGEERIRNAFAAIERRLRRATEAKGAGSILAQRMAGPGVELILGARQADAFGTVIAVGVGGTLVEIIRQASVRLAPVDREAALAMLDETPAGRLLRGVRGRGPYDIEAAADALIAFARLAHAAGDALRAIEINPLIVLEQGKGVLGVDVVFEA